MKPPLDAGYTFDQQRVADYIVEVSKGQVGGRSDPVGFLIASHAALSRELWELRARMGNQLGDRGYRWVSAAKEDN